MLVSKQMLTSNPQNWTCPYCGRDQVVTDAQRYAITRKIEVAFTQHKEVGFTLLVNACSNKDCLQTEVTLWYGPGSTVSTMNGPPFFQRSKDNQERYPLRPSSSAKPQPDCVPAQIAADYYEACAIRNRSPKASATLSRRVLQGMIRDFCGISKTRLIDEIKELRKRVDEGDAPKGVLSDSVDAIDHVRAIGNIGAHMEKDINVIVDVKPIEAQKLIELVEMLFKDWYVSRKAREDRFADLKQIATDKTKAKRPPA